MSTIENTQNQAHPLRGIIALENSDFRQPSLDLIFGKPNIGNNLLSTPSNSRSQQLKTPGFRQNQNYSVLCDHLEKFLAQSLDSIKETSLEINWLQESVDLQDCGLEEAKISVNLALGERRRRRAPTELTRDNACPFVNCSKIYASKNALKLHIRRNHSLADTLKSNDHISISCLPKMTSCKRGVNLKSVFKGPHAKKMESRGFDYANTFDESSEKNLMSFKSENCSQINFNQLTHELDRRKKSIHEESTQGSLGQVPTTYSHSKLSSTRSDQNLQVAIMEDFSDAGLSCDLNKMLLTEKHFNYNPISSDYEQEKYHDYFEHENCNFMRKASSHQAEDDFSDFSDPKEEDFFCLRQNSEPSGCEQNIWIERQSRHVMDLECSNKTFVCDYGLVKSVSQRFRSSHDCLISSFE